MTFDNEIRRHLSLIFDKSRRYSLSNTSVLASFKLVRDAFENDMRLGPKHTVSFDIYEAIQRELVHSIKAQAMPPHQKMAAVQLVSTLHTAWELILNDLTPPPSAKKEDPLKTLETRAAQERDLRERHLDAASAYYAACYPPTESP